MKADGSPRNALKHGFTARKILPERLRLHTAQLKGQLAAELQPASALENILVDELARHAAALQFTHRAEPAVLRCGAACQPQMTTLIGLQHAEPADVTLLAAVTSDGLEKFSRYRRSHERGLYTALGALTRLRDRSELSVVQGLRERFAAEEACRNHLRQRRQKLPCKRCGNTMGSWLKERERWECSGCKVQLGPRAGTVMEHSPIPLAAWFAAILEAVANPAVTASELTTVTGIERLATLRGMLAKIRTAENLPAAEAELRLAGLPQLCAKKLT